MDWKKFMILSTFGFLAGWMAYRAYIASNVFTALLTLFLASWILVQYSSKLGAWQSLEVLLNPFLVAIYGSFLGFIYGSTSGYGTNGAIMFGIVGFLLGSAISMWLFKYWDV